MSLIWTQSKTPKTSIRLRVTKHRRYRFHVFVKTINTGRQQSFKEGGLRLADKVLRSFQNALTFLFFKVMRSKFENFFVSSWNVYFWANKRIRARLGRAKVALSTFIWKIVILRFKSFSYPEFQTVQRTTKDQKSPEIDGAQFFLHRKKKISFELFLSAEKSQCTKIIIFCAFPQVWDLLL